MLRSEIKNTFAAPVSTSERTTRSKEPSTARYAYMMPITIPIIKRTEVEIITFLCLSKKVSSDDVIILVRRVDISNLTPLDEIL